MGVPDPVDRRGRGRRELTECIGTAIYFAHCLQVSIERIAQGSVSPPALTPRELEILRWTAIGKTSWQISRILRIAERTVNFHLQGAARKLGTQGRRATCARAVAQGLIVL